MDVFKYETVSRDSEGQWWRRVETHNKMTGPTPKHIKTTHILRQLKHIRANSPNSFFGTLLVISFHIKFHHLHMLIN